MTIGLIDVIYLTKDLDESAKHRFQLSILSLKRSNIKPRLIVSDTSEKDVTSSLKGILDSCGVTYLITHESCSGLFNRSRTINNGVHFVTSDSFIVMDIDLIAPKGFLDDLVTVYEEKGCTYLPGYIGYLKSGCIPTSAFEDVVATDVERWFSSGYFICNHDLFTALNGFDEGYVGWGGEDSDFDLRVSLKLGVPLVELRRGAVGCYHQHHPSPETVFKDVAKKNRQRYFDRKQLYEDYQLRLDHVKGLEEK